MIEGQGWENVVLPSSLSLRRQYAAIGDTG
jgi:hypothetical protein